MALVNLFLKDELLDKIDREAHVQRLNRSSLVQTALEEYLETKRKEREGEAKPEKMREAALRMDVLAKKLGAWDPQETIRKFRDTNLQGQE